MRTRQSVKSSNKPIRRTAISMVAYIVVEYACPAMLPLDSTKSLGSRSDVIGEKGFAG